VARTKQVIEVLGAAGAVVALLTWFTGKPDLPALVGALKLHHQQSATASPTTKAATAPPTKTAGTRPTKAGTVQPDHAGTTAKSAASPSKKPNPLTVSLTMDSVHRVGEDRYRGGFSYRWAVKLNGKNFYDCLGHERVYSPSGKLITPLDVNPPCQSGSGDQWDASYFGGLSPGVYTVKVDVTSDQGYKGSVSHSFTLVK
jgi:hypothetical protein